MADFKKTRLPNSEWHLGTDGEAWRLYPPGNTPHIFLGVWSKKQATAIACMIENSYEQGASDVRNEIKEALRIGDA
jgi:hypothetical protein